MKTFFEKLPDGTLVNYSLQDDGWNTSYAREQGIVYSDIVHKTLSEARNGAWRVYSTMRSLLS